MSAMSMPNGTLGKKHKDYLSVLAYIYLKTNQLEKAIVVYKALWHLFPETENLPFCLSYLYLRTRKFEAALFYADTYLQQKSSGLGFLLKGQAHSLLGQPQEAGEAIRSYFMKQNQQTELLEAR